MAMVLLPPGNKIKKLSALEIIQLSDVIKHGHDLEASFKILEQNWASGPDVYDIDLINIAVTPLSQVCDFDAGLKLAKLMQAERKLKMEELEKEKKDHFQKIKKMKQTNREKQASRRLCNDLKKEGRKSENPKKGPQCARNDKEVGMVDGEKEQCKSDDIANKQKKEREPHEDLVGILEDWDDDFVIPKKNKNTFCNKT